MLSSRTLDTAEFFPRPDMCKILILSAGENLPGKNLPGKICRGKSAGENLPGKNLPGKKVCWGENQNLFSQRKIPPANIRAAR